MRVRLVVRVANAAGVTAPQRAAGCARRALTAPGGYGLPDVVLLSEVAPVDVTDVAARHAPRFDVIQRGEIGSAWAGVAIAAVPPLVELEPVVGSPSTREGRGIRLRPILRGLLDRLPVAAVHVPPGRAPLAAAVYFAAMRLVGGLIGGDMNAAPAWMRRTFARKYRGHPDDVLGLLVPATWRASDPTPVDIDSDHRAWDFVVWVPAWRVRRLTQPNR